MDCGLLPRMVRPTPTLHTLSPTPIRLLTPGPRPPPAGGLVISDDGYFAKAVHRRLSYRAVRRSVLSPQYAGIPGPLVVEPARDMRLGVDLPFQALG